MRYKAVCQNENCEWKETIYDYIARRSAEAFAEIHMMKTGHIVDIVEVYGKKEKE